MVLPRREAVSAIGYKMAESVQQWQREIVDVMTHIDGKHFTIDSWGNEHRSGTRYLFTRICSKWESGLI